MGFVSAWTGLAARVSSNALLIYFVCWSFYHIDTSCWISYKAIRGVRFTSDLFISHLLFANDSLILCRASLTDCCHLKGIFYCYSAASRQNFNYDKSSILFSPNVTHNVRCDIKTLFGLAEVPIYERYLGLPAMVGRNRRYFFRDLKLSCWQDKSFSCGGKEVLIKAVAQAIPSYTMSVFCLPGFLSDAFQRQFNAFWWGSNEHRRRIHWMGWRKMSQPKKLGVLGFRILSVLINPC